MSAISPTFFTPIVFNTSNWVLKTSEYIDHYFHLGGTIVDARPSTKKTKQFGIENYWGPAEANITPWEGSYKVTSGKCKFFKIISYCTLIISLVMLIAKFIFRKIALYLTNVKISTVPRIRLTASQIPSIPRDQVIADGYGEFIVQKRSGTNLEQVDFSTFEKVATVLERTNILQWTKDNPQKNPQERFEDLKAKVQQIDQNLEITFVPKVLYEMVFLRQSIEEDLAKEAKFPYQNPNSPTEEELKKVRQLCYRKNNSWLNFDWSKEIIFSTSPKAASLEIVDQDPIPPETSLRLLEIAHRLNGVFCKLLGDKGIQNHCTFGQLESLFEEQIAFFESIYYETTPKGKHPLSIRAKRIINCNEPGPSSQFVGEYNRSSLQPLGIANQELADILRKVFLIECSERAKGKVILYRGGKLEEDLPTRNFDGKTVCYSNSYGIGTFSDPIFDPGATPYFYMRKEDRDAYAIILDPSEQEDLFFIPNASTIRSFFCSGEYSHSRSKAYLLEKDDRVHGICTMSNVKYHTLPEYMKSSRKKEDFINLFKNHVKNAIVLKVAA